MRRSSLRILNCSERIHCRTCRTDADWRERVVGEREFECPYGVTADNLPSEGLGDTIAKGIKAATFGLVKPCGGCKKRQEKLNHLFPYEKK